MELIVIITMSKVQSWRFSLKKKAELSEKSQHGLFVEDTSEFVFTCSNHCRFEHPHLYRLVRERRQYQDGALDICDYEDRNKDLTLLLHQPQSGKKIS